MLAKKIRILRKGIDMVDEHGKFKAIDFSVQEVVEKILDYKGRQAQCIYYMAPGIDLERVIIYADGDFTNAFPPEGKFEACLRASQGDHVFASQRNDETTTLIAEY